MEIKELTFPQGATTRDQLILATQVLVASYGYEGTTTRMIANLAKATLSTINFHFGNKELLVKAAIEAACEGLRHYYRGLTDEICEFLQHEPVDPQKAWAYIDRLLAEKQRSRRRATFILKDVRVFLNSLDRSLELMQRGGIAARVRREDTPDGLVLTISIPRSRNG